MKQYPHFASTVARNAYDHLLRYLVVTTKDMDLARAYGVPISTSNSWNRRKLPNVVALRDLHADVPALLAENARLRRKLKISFAIIKLLLACARALGIRLDDQRLPDGEAKKTVLVAIQRTCGAIPLAHALRVLHISRSRYNAWLARDVRCRLDDLPSCPRTRPMRISAVEIIAIKTMALSTALAHLSTRALALLAQRQNIVHVSVQTWYRLILEHGWRRPRTRVHPRPPTVGIRADAPGKIIHIDVTVVRLLDGSRAFIQAIIDNCSRMILGYAICSNQDRAERDPRH